MLIYIATYITEQFTLRECVSVCDHQHRHVEVHLCTDLAQRLLQCGTSSSSGALRELIPYDMIPLRAAIADDFRLLTEIETGNGKLLMKCSPCV